MGSLIKGLEDNLFSFLAVLIISTLVIYGNVEGFRRNIFCPEYFLSEICVFHAYNLFVIKLCLFLTSFDAIFSFQKYFLSEMFFNPKYSSSEIL